MRRVQFFVVCSIGLRDSLVSDRDLKKQREAENVLQVSTPGPGQYESNLVALTLANTYADHILKCHETLKMIKAAPMGDTCTREDLASTANETKRLLAKIESVIRPDSGLAMISSSSNESPVNNLWDRASSEQSELTGSGSLDSNMSADSSSKISSRFGQ